VGSLLEEVQIIYTVKSSEASVKILQRPFSLSSCFSGLRMGRYDTSKKCSKGPSKEEWNIKHNVSTHTFVIYSCIYYSFCRSTSD